jgi:glycosyltransferase involved in cell wall biosynthesis
MAESIYDGRNQEQTASIDLSLSATRELAFLQDPSSELRRARLQRLFSLPTVGPLDRGAFAPGVVVIIPTYGDPSRTGSIRAAIASVAAQAVELPIRLLLADNGMTEAQAAPLLAWARELGLPADVVPAHPTCDEQKSAGHARNVALEWLHARAGEDPRYRLDALLLLDDDVAMLPGALAEMYAVLRTQPRAVAVIPKNIQVPRLDESSWVAACAGYDGPEDDALPPHRMPALMVDGAIDMASIVAFSGQVASKTNCLLLDASALHGMLRAGASSMVGGPYGSAEDMMLSVGLQRLGYVYSCLRATVLDREPESRGVFGQRCQYGRDHVVIHNDLVMLEHGRPGVLVLESDGRSWWQWFVPKPGVYGVVIAPEQLARISVLLTRHAIDETSVGSSSRTRHLHGLRPERIYLGVAFLERLLRQIDGHRDRAERRLRPDLPAPEAHPPSALRWNDTSRMGQLVGNLMGLFDVHVSPGLGLRSFVFGVRQTVTWTAETQAAATLAA